MGKTLFEQFNYKIPNFEFVQDLGQGGFGHVFLMREKSQIGLIRAVKVLNPSPFVDDATAKIRFKNEAESLLKLQHPSIVHYIISGFSTDAGNFPYLAMDYVEGNDLLKFAESASPIQKAIALKQILEALSYSHSNKVFHRDIKPSNILIRKSDGLPVIVDFGFSFLPERIVAQTITRAAVGSLGYIPPEVISNPKLRTPQHDIFSCGSLLYRLFTPTTPNIQEYAPLSSINQDLSGLDIIIQKAIAPINSRFATPSEFIESLSHWISVQEAKEKMNYSCSDFRKKLINKRNENEERKALEKIQNKTILALATQAHSEICAAAEIVFRSTVLALSEELDNRYEFKQLPMANWFEQNSDTVRDMYQILDRIYNHKLAIGHVLVGDRHGMRKIENLVPWPIKSNPYHRNFIPPRFDILPVGWIIYTESDRQSPRVIKLAGIIVECKIKEPTFPLKYYINGSDFFGQNIPEVVSGQQIQNLMQKIIENHYTR